MGALPKLKIKTELHYRKGHTNESQNCKACENFTEQYFRRSNHCVREFRCMIIGGLDKESIRYRVRDDFTCDRQVMSDAYDRELARMRGIVA